MPSETGEDQLISRRIGPYRLVRELGRGGMATVYLGTRDDGQFSKDVAIKLIGAMTPSPESLRRFEEEQQILATLEHPNIARLLDGGVTEDGLHYIIMEYIQGLCVDEYCEQKGLRLEERLRLFKTICSAVHFAHQRLVVHRDLKPGNILVTDRGEPKLLDFGIAKILDPVDDTGLRQATRTLFHAMTPDYASPEQLQGGTVTTASDVYSLGIVLYELLAGARPYRLEGTTLGDKLRIVCEQDPERPSVAASKPELRGDLDAIVLKAMRKEPQERYASAIDFSSDIGRYLSHFPVLAGRGSYRYVARKFIERHKFAVGAAGVATLLTIAGIGGIVLESRVARTERARAERRFNDVRRLASSVIFEMHDAIASMPGSTPVRKLLVTRALEYLDSLAAEAQGDDSLQLELADAYVRVGDVQGGATVANLGDTKGAFESYEKARKTLRMVLARRPALKEGRVRLANLNNNLCSEYLLVGDRTRAIEAAKEALSGWTAIAKQSHEDEESLQGMASAHFSVAGVMEVLEKPEEALAEYQASEKIYETLLAAAPQNARTQRNLALSHKSLCNVYENFDVAKAVEHCQIAVDLDEKRAAAKPGDLLAKQDLAYSLSESGTILQKKGDLAAASRSFARSLVIRQSVVDSDPQNVRARTSLVYPHLALGSVLEDMGKLDESVKEYRTAARLGDAIVENYPADSKTRDRTAEAYYDIGGVEVKLARWAPASSQKRVEQMRNACTDYRRAQERYRENERRGSASEYARKSARELASDMRVCSQ